MKFSQKLNIYKSPKPAETIEENKHDEPPAYIRNQALKKKVLDMEKSVEDAITSHCNQSEYNIEQYTAFLDSQEFLKNLPTDLRHNHEETTKVYQVSSEQ